MHDATYSTADKHRDKPSIISRKPSKWADSIRFHGGSIAKQTSAVPPLTRMMLNKLRYRGKRLLLMICGADLAK